MKYYFELRKDKVTKEGLVPIRLIIKIKSDVIKRNLGLSCRVEDWNGSRIMPNSKKEKYNGHVEINNEIQRVENRLDEISIYFRACKIEITKDAFIDKFDDVEETIVPEVSFDKSFEKFIDEGKISKAFNTIKAQTTVKNFFKEYFEERDYSDSFDSITTGFFHDLSMYCFEEKGIKNNYFAKIIAVLKTFMRWAIRKGLTENRDFEQFRAAEHDIDIVYLTFDELMTLYNKEFESDHLSHVRDIYCMGCFSSLRFSDLSRLHLANITSDHIILSITKTKTQNHAIKLNKYAKAILAKYKGTIHEPLPVISAQKLNESIKTCCKIAKIDYPVTVNWYVGTMKKSDTKPKYEFITSHTARKTFITNSLLLGMEPKAIKKIANIKKDAVLDKYMKITEAFTDEQMDKAWN